MDGVEVELDDAGVEVSDDVDVELDDAEVEVPQQPSPGHGNSEYLHVPEGDESSFHTERFLFSLLLSSFADGGAMTAAGAGGTATSAGLVASSVSDGSPCVRAEVSARASSEWSPMPPLTSSCRLSAVRGLP